MSTRRDQAGRNALLQEVLAVDEPPAEYLVRYANAPDSLTAEERQVVEEALARSPTTADQIRVLQSFDPGDLRDEPEPSSAQRASRGGPLASLLRFRGEFMVPLPARAWVPGALAGALLGVFLYGELLDAANRVDQLKTELAEAQLEHEDTRHELAKVREQATEERSVLDSLREEVQEKQLELAALREQLEDLGEQMLLAQEAGATPGAAQEEPRPAGESAVEVGQLRQELAAAEVALEEKLRELAGLREEATEQRSTTASLREESRAQQLELAALREQLEDLGYQTPTALRIARADVPRFVSPTDSLSYPVPRENRTRGAMPSSAGLVALVPQGHAGQTIKAAPILYWFLPHRTTQPLELIVADSERDEAILEVELPGPHPAGIHGFDLATRGVQLDEGRIYAWYLLRSGTMAGGGAIHRIAPSEELESALRRAGPEGTSHLYAAQGLWYDALSELSTRIDATPGDSGLREQRAGLLEQVGLDRAAAYDRSH